MALLPLAAAMRDDFVVQLVPVDDADTMATVAEKVAVHSIGLRVPLSDTPMTVVVRGEPVSADTTVADAGLGPMDFVEVRYGDG